MSKTIGDLKVGAKIKFGAYSVNGEIPHKVCWQKVDENNTFLTEFVEDVCAFDAKEPDNDSELRRQYGNCRYSVSNVDQFINAYGDNWYAPQHEHDAPPTEDNLFYERNAYYNKPGFLTWFENWEINAIEISEVVTSRIRKDTNDINDGMKSDVVYRQVFLPSVTNLSGEKTRGVAEGKRWDINIGGGWNFSTYPTSELAKAIGHEAGSFIAYNLRTPYGDMEHANKVASSYGGLSEHITNDPDMGLRPALRIIASVIVSDEPDENGYYEVIPAEQEIIEINEQDLIAILF